MQLQKVTFTELFYTLLAVHINCVCFDHDYLMLANFNVRRQQTNMKRGRFHFKIFKIQDYVENQAFFKGAYLNSCITLTLKTVRIKHCPNFQEFVQFLQFTGMFWKVLMFKKKTQNKTQFLCTEWCRLCWSMSSESRDRERSTHVWTDLSSIPTMLMLEEFHTGTGPGQYPSDNSTIYLPRWL